MLSPGLKSRNLLNSFRASSCGGVSPQAASSSCSLSALSALFVMPTNWLGPYPGVSWCSVTADTLYLSAVSCAGVSFRNSSWKAPFAVRKTWCTKPSALRPSEERCKRDSAPEEEMHGGGNPRLAASSTCCAHSPSSLPLTQLYL